MKSIIDFNVLLENVFPEVCLLVNISIQIMQYSQIRFLKHNQQKEHHHFASHH